LGEDPHFGGRGVPVLFLQFFGKDYGADIRLDPGDLSALEKRVGGTYAVISTSFGSMGLFRQLSILFSFSSDSGAGAFSRLAGPSGGQIRS
jgi:hypothetical protein